MVFKGEKLGGGPVDQSTDVLWIEMGAFFLKSGEFVQRC
jgi:hypothetical protein